MNSICKNCGIRIVNNNGYWRHEPTDTYGVITEEYFTCHLEAEPIDDEPGSSYNTGYYLREVSLEPYVRVGGDALCSTCGRRYYDHPKERKYDAFDGQDMELIRACDGQLLKT